MGGDDVSRIIRWGKKYRYAGHHISPRSIAPNGIESHTLPQISAQELASNNIFCYHYGLIFPSQVFRKQSFYSGGGKLSSTATRDQQSDCEEPNRWAQQVWRDLKDPFHVHNVYMHLAWLVKYRGPQPEITKQLFSESGSFFLPEPWRGDKDINELISQFSFRFKRRALIILAALNFHPATPPGLRKAASLISCSLAQQGLRKTSTSVLNKISKKLKVYE